VSLPGLLAELFCGDDSRAEAAAIQFGNYGEAGIQALQPYLDDHQLDRRWWAIRSLAQINHRHARPYLVQALSDVELSVRQCAALGLCQQPTASAIYALIDALSDPDSLLRRLACNALIAIGPPAVPALLPVLDTCEQSARLEAVRALAKIGDPEAIAALYAVWGEDSAMLEYWADEGLDRMLNGMVYFYP
jgi:HEAT repeat protein